MRCTLARVFGSLSERGKGGPAREEQHVTVWGRSQPATRGKAFEPRGQIRKKQARAIEAITLTYAEDLFADPFEAKGARLSDEVLHRLLPNRGAIERPSPDFMLAKIARSRAVSKLKRQMHVGADWVEVQALFGRQRFQEFARNQPRQETRRGFEP